jgi:hypothetical protein
VCGKVLSFFLIGSVSGVSSPGGDRLKLRGEKRMSTLFKSGLAFEKGQQVFIPRTAKYYNVV